MKNQKIRTYIVLDLAKNGGGGSRPFRKKKIFAMHFWTTLVYTLNFRISNSLFAMHSVMFTWQLGENPIQGKKWMIYFKYVRLYLILFQKVCLNISDLLLLKETKIYTWKKNWISFLTMVNIDPKMRHRLTNTQ